MEIPLFSAIVLVAPVFQCIGQVPHGVGQLMVRYRVSGLSYQ